ncbi:MAG TPA: hypothetical protein VFK42_15580 [Acidimicrobiales bacterium]|nr:hypothetical protein [Acidimicrobiales bacterium]
MAGSSGRRTTRARAFLPTALVGVLCLGLTTAATFGGAGRAAAQENSPGGGTPFANGQAKSHAQVFAVAPGVGNIDFGVASGTSTAEIVNDLAQAQSRTLDLGLIGSSLVGEKCDGSKGLDPSDLPSPLTVDNREGDASKHENEVPDGDSPLAGGRRDVRATKTPSADATVSAVSAVLGPVATVSGGRAQAIARVVDHAAREAVASTSMDLSIAGVIDLQGLRWEASHRTGTAGAVTGAFSIEHGSAAGAPLPVDDLGAAQQAINAALAPSGVTIEMPRVEKLAAPNNLVRVTPLRITLRDSPLGKALAGPGLNLTREQRSQLFDAIVGVYCRAAELLLVGDITLSVASGTGFLVVDLGGVEATSGDLDLHSPFEDLPAFTPPGVVLPSTSDGGARSTPAAVPDAVGAAPVGAATPVVSARGDTGPLDTFCESVRPGGGRCNVGLGVPVGVAGVALTCGVGYLDWWRRRRALADVDA